MSGVVFHTPSDKRWAGTRPKVAQMPRPGRVTKRPARAGTPGHTPSDVWSAHRVGRSRVSDDDETGPRGGALPSARRKIRRTKGTEIARRTRDRGTRELRPSSPPNTPAGEDTAKTDPAPRHGEGTRELRPSSPPNTPAGETPRVGRWTLGLHQAVRTITTLRRLGVQADL